MGSRSGEKRFAPPDSARFPPPELGNGSHAGRVCSELGLGFQMQIPSTTKQKNQGPNSRFLNSMLNSMQPNRALEVSDGWTSVHLSLLVAYKGRL